MTLPWLQLYGITMVIAPWHCYGCSSMALQALQLHGVTMDTVVWHYCGNVAVSDWLLYVAVLQELRRMGCHCYCNCNNMLHKYVTLMCYINMLQK